jgi:hypothetical protein
VIYLLGEHMKVVADSDVLIKLTKTGSKEIIVSLLEVFIPKRVHEETVIESEDCSDARTIQENINEGKIYVTGSPCHEKGEIEALRLYRSGGFELIVSDDRKFLKHLERFNPHFALTLQSIIFFAVLPE